MALTSVCLRYHSEMKLSEDTDQLSSQWKAFNFFDVSSVKLPEDCSSILKVHDWLSLNYPSARSLTLTISEFA